MVKPQKTAFSLVEILISLITISLIMAAFAPVYTKKVGAASAGLSKGNTAKPFPYNPMDPNCTKVDNSIDCKFKVPNGVTRLTAVLVSGGGGGAGASAGQIIPNQIKEASASSAEIPVTKTMKNVVIADLIGAGGGGGGGAFYNTGDANAPSVAFCNKVGALFVPAAYNGAGGKDLCVMKQNMCYKTLHPEYATQEPGPCSTPDKYGMALNNGKSDCRAYRRTTTKAGSWRLPTAAEIAGWANVINNETKSSPKIQKWLYSKGLNFCDDSTNAAQYGSNQCQGSGNNYSFILADGATYWLTQGVFKKLSTNDRGMVRCVYAGTVDASGNVSNTPSSYSSAGGGAGSAGSKITSLKIPDNIISSAIGGKIVISAGVGGNAGAKGASNGASGTAGGNGGLSKVTVYNSSNTAIYQITAAGGNGGKGAAKTSAGAGGSASNSCSGATCTSQNNAGNNGLANINKTTNITSSGGAQTGSGYGAGGAGGSATGTSANTGAKGANGYVKITYDIYYQGAGGGGGGGASLVHIDNIPVTPQKEYTVRIGGAGKGGAYSNNGADGGESAVWFDTMSAVVSGGKGGLKGTGETSTSSLTQGTGGAMGVVSKTGEAGTIFIQKAGTKGSDAAAVSSGSSGGLGGLSGGQSESACGGLFLGSSVCTNASVNGETLPYESYGNIYHDGNYGIAGSGGGGGGWGSDITAYPLPGSGGKGQNGYVYIYWDK